MGVLAALVVFCTTYALILPAMTAERQTICGMEAHEHTEECFENGVQICGKQEHIHTEECYAKGKGITVGVIVGPQGNSVADVPSEPAGGELEVDLSGDGTATPEEGTQLTPEQQEQEAQAQEAQRQEEQNQLAQRLAEVTLTGTWADDVVAAAKAHAGCQEDGRGLIDAVLQFSGVEGIPQASDGVGGYTGYADWVSQIRAAGRYKDSSKIPKEGDVVFLDQDADSGTLGYEDDRIDHAGIVVRVETEKKTVEATGEKIKMLKAIMVLTDNAEGKIDSFFYNMEDPANMNRIAGYARLPKNPSQGEAEEPDEENHTGGAPEQETAPAETEQQTETQQSEAMTESQIGEQPEAAEGQTEEKAAEPAEDEQKPEGTAAEDQSGEEITPTADEGYTENKTTEQTAEGQGPADAAADGQTQEAENKTEPSEMTTPADETKTDAEDAAGTPGTEAETDMEMSTETDTNMSADEDMETEPETDTEIDTEEPETDLIAETPEMATEADMEMSTEADTDMSADEDMETVTETDAEEPETESWITEPETESPEAGADIEVPAGTDMEAGEPETADWGWTQEELEEEASTEDEIDDRGWLWTDFDTNDDTGEHETESWNPAEEKEAPAGTDMEAGEPETAGWGWTQEELEEEPGTEAEIDDRGWLWTDFAIKDDTGENETESLNPAGEDFEQETETEWDEWDHLEAETETEAAGSDPEADLETSGDWEASVAGVELTSIWAEDLTMVAETQIGVKESTENFTLNENGEQKGITRYGQWYGEPYGDWDAMFVSFCLNYAEVPHSSVPRAGSCGALAGMLQTYGLYENPAEYEASRGDLVFLDTDADGTADHVGILEDVTESGINVIAGDMEDEVKVVAYAKGDAAVIGYGRLPQKPDQKIYKKEFNDGEIKVVAEYTAEAMIPDNAKFIVTEVPQDDERFKEGYEAVQEMINEERQSETEEAAQEEGISTVSLEDDLPAEGETETETEEQELYMRIYNIGFYVDEQKISPQTGVKLSIEFLDNSSFAAGVNKIIHMEKGKEPEALEVTTSDGGDGPTKKISFETPTL